jgi:hypothetical protein
VAARQFLGESSSVIVPASASTLIMSPSWISAIGPPTAASGPTWPMHSRGCRR